MLYANSPQRNQVLRCIVWRNSPQLTLGSKETGGKGLETFMSCDGSDLGENILDLIVELGVDLLGPKTLGKATIRPGASVVSLIYTPCCWRILLSSGKYCSLPRWIACGWQIAPALHSIWSEAAHTLLPVFPHLHPPASVILPCPSRFLSRRWPFRWCLSRPPWPVAPLGAIMDSVLIACWRTEAVLRGLIADSLESTTVCLCDCCSNAARLENSPSMCPHVCRWTQCTSHTQITHSVNMHTFLVAAHWTSSWSLSVKRHQMMSHSQDFSISVHLSGYWDTCLRSILLPVLAPAKWHWTWFTSTWPPLVAWMSA